MKIITLTDNNANDCNLQSEHGLSTYIEADNHKILFDTGKSDVFINNAQKLGIDLTEVDLVIISHGHSDHIGGLIKFLQLNQKAKIYLKKEIFDFQYYSVKNNVYREIGHSAGLEKHKNRLYFLGKNITIIDSCLIINSIEKKYSLPRGNNDLYKFDKTTYEPDDFQHELVFLINSPGGLCVFSGYAHNGILNILDTVKNIFPSKKIKLIYGGLHLIDGNKFFHRETGEELYNIALEMDKLSGMTELYTGHCTGKMAVEELRKVLGNRFHSFYAGHEIEF